MSNNIIQLDHTLWNKKLDDTEINPTDINNLIMNYFEVEGFKEAAENFQLETETKPQSNLNDIVEREKIRSSIQKGEIKDSIQLINDFDPEILEDNQRLIFSLKQQHLIELIRKGEISEALNYAQNDLVGLCLTRKDLLEDLEQSLALLAFDEKDQQTSPVGDLLSISHRQKIANFVNSAILSNQLKDQESRLSSILKLLLWSQTQLSEKAHFPKIDFDTKIEF